MTSSPSRPRLATLATERLADARAEELAIVESERAENVGAANERARQTEQNTIDAMALAIRGAARQRRQRRALLIAAASAASLLLAAAAIMLVVRGSNSHSNTNNASNKASTSSFAAVARSLNEGGVHIRSGKEVTLVPGATVPLETGDHVVAKSHSIGVELTTGTRISLDPSTEMAVVDDLALTKQSFMLHHGRLHADVAKLGPDQRFLVRTADVEVEVRGTSFVVESGLSECAGSTTRVRVSEGVVVVRSVRGEARVAAGGLWPTTCEASLATAAPSASPPSAPPTPPPTSPPIVTGNHAKPALPTPQPISELADQNRLYAEATAARRRGANAEAIRAYDRFLSRYPNGQLAESAAVERMRLLGTSAAARDYLARYPRGFARDEATKLLAATQ